MRFSSFALIAAAISLFAAAGCAADDNQLGHNPSFGSGASSAGGSAGTAPVDCADPTSCFQKCVCQTGQGEQCATVCNSCVAPKCSECGSCMQQCLCLTNNQSSCASACGASGSGGTSGTGAGGFGGIGGSLGSGGYPATGGTGFGSGGGGAGGTVAGGASGTGGTLGTGGIGGSGATLGTGGSGGGAATSCANDGTSWPLDWQAYECQVLDLTNQRRAQGATCGGVPYPPAPPLTMNAMLRQSAREHAEDMGDNNYFDHNSLNGDTPSDRMMAAGYIGRMMGENIAEGQPTPADVVNGWMQSPGHCTNIMTAGYKDLGVGYYYAPNNPYHYIWVQNFGG